MRFTKEEWDTVLLCTARTIAYHTGAFRELEKVYRKNEVEYARLSNEHPLRHCRAMNALPLDYEVKTSHMLGLLVAADGDEELKKKVIKQLRGEYPCNYEAMKNPTEENVRKAQHETAKERHSQPYSVLWGTYFFDYIWETREKSGKLVSDLSKKEYLYYLDDLDFQKGKILAYIEQKHDIQNDDIVVVDKDLRRIIGSWEGISRFSALIFHINDSMDELGWNETLYSAMQSDHKKEQLLRALREKMLAANLNFYIAFIEKPEHEQDAETIYDCTQTLLSVCEWAGYDFRALNPNELSPKLQNELIYLSRIDHGKDAGNFSLVKYIYNLFIYRLLQEYGKAKQQYFRDNEESRLLEQKQQRVKSDAQQQEIQELQRKLAKLQEENQAVLEENQRLRGQLLSAEREAQEKYESRIAQMQEVFDEQQRKLYDLTPLREFFFSQENEEAIADTSVSLEEAAAGLKIATLGGHEVLLKKLKQNYPEFLVLDGTLKSIDFSAQLRNVNLLFLFTEHMSHSVYDNAVAAAERYRIPLAYIRSSNLEAIERQMSAEIEHLKQSERR